jgi:hypothetical protein
VKSVELAFLQVSEAYSLLTLLDAEYDACHKVCTQRYLLPVGVLLYHWVLKDLLESEVRE